MDKIQNLNVTKCDLNHFQVALAYEQLAYATYVNEYSSGKLLRFKNIRKKIQHLSGKFGVARAYAQAALDILGQFCAHFSPSFY